MYLESKVEVTYNDPSSIAGQATGIVTGHLGSVSILPDDSGKEFNKLQANFAYAVNGEAIHTNSFEVSGEDMEQLWAAVRPSVPKDETYQVTETTKYYI